MADWLEDEELEWFSVQALPAPPPAPGGPTKKRPRPRRSSAKPSAHRRSGWRPLLLALLALAVAAGGVAAALGGGGRHHAVRQLPAANGAPANAEPAPATSRTPAERGRQQRLLPAADLFPFQPSRRERRANQHDALPRFWDDGQPCSVGCRPSGAIDGWPLGPFHSQHPLRAGLNELRADSLHVGLDIQTRGSHRVFAIQPGRAHIIQAAGGEARVQVGDYIYWHIRVRVSEGQLVRPYRTVVGITIPAYGHLHLSEVQGGVYLNPLRPGGRVLAPWSDHVFPVIGPPHMSSDGSVRVKAFDPQSFIRRTRYQTPVLAPAALGYQVFTPGGKRIVPLHWALRGTHTLPFNLASVIYAPGSSSPGFDCFLTQVICKPNWDYVLAGGLAPRLSQLGLPAARYRLSVYAWDWAGNARAHDAWFEVTSSGVRAVHRPRSGGRSGGRQRSGGGRALGLS